MNKLVEIDQFKQKTVPVAQDGFQTQDDNIFSTR